jgi:leucyl-tRNA synthetase
LWAELGHETLVADTPWPQFDDSLTVDNNVKLAVQVNGKVRDTIEVPKDMAKDEIEKIALANEKVIKFMDGKTIRKVIVVPGRIVNIVVG